jgi:RHS repeat-associated protein
VAKTNASRTIVERSEYEPYGKLLNHPLEDGPGYTGHVSDAATGLSYMQQRYYDPGIGTFLSVDPVTANSMGGNFNRYWYANNNPYRFRDPDGRQAQSNSGSSHSDKPSCETLACREQAQADRNSQRNSPFTGGQFHPAGSMLQLIQNIGVAVKDRTSATASAEGAIGSGLEGEATKNTYGKPDTVGAGLVLGVGAHIGADVNYRLLSWGSQSGSTGGRLIVNPSSYLKIKLGAGFSLGLSLNFNDRGGGDLSVAVGGGFGAGVFYKPPATVGYEKEL